MRAQRLRSASPIARAAVALSLGMGLGHGTAEAVPVQSVSSSTPSDSDSPKKVTAECPAGMSVLGGGANIGGGQGQVAIQAAFPTYDPGLDRFVFVVKAAEQMSGTSDNWSLTAIAYCTPTVSPTLVEEVSAFDSEPIKSVTVACPKGTKVVGMGGEVSKSADSHPAPLVGNIPAALVVFQGVEPDADLTNVTARAAELSGAIGGSVSGSWKVTAIAACEQPLYFDGLELRSNTETGGGFTESESEIRLDVYCSSKNKRIIAAASTVDDDNMGRWYLDRFSPFNAVYQHRLSAESYRNSGVGVVKQAGYILCVD